MKIEIDKHNAVNCVNKKVLLSNVKFWSKKGFALLEKQHVNKKELVILAGGASLEEYKPDGRATIACGTAIKRCAELGITPDFWLNLDPLKDMIEFAEIAPKETIKIIATTSDKSLFRHCDKNTTVLFYPTSFEYNCKHRKILNGTTVGITSIVIGLHMGFRRFDCYGLDSCVIDGEEHASGYYKRCESKEINKEDTSKKEIISIECNGKEFDCTPQNVMQAIDFKNICTIWGEKFLIHFHGKGLLAQMMKGDSNE